MAALVTPDVQEAAISGAIASVPLPKGVRLRRFFFDTDFTGDPALRVVYGVSKKLPLTKKRVVELSKFRRTVADLLWDLPFEHIPYVTFEDVR